MNVPGLLGYLQQSDVHISLVAFVWRMLSTCDADIQKIDLQITSPVVTLLTWVEDISDLLTAYLVPLMKTCQ